jgi:hypothetical protein
VHGTERARTTSGRAVRAGAAALTVGALLLGLTATTAGPAGASSSSLKTQAKKALLVKSDLPSGWTSSPGSSGGGTFPGATQLAKCLDLPVSVINANPPTVSSPDFSSKNGLLSVGDSVSIDASTSIAKMDFDSLADSQAPACLTAAFNGPARSELSSGFGKGASMGTVTVSRTPSSDFGPHTAHVTLFVPVTQSGTTLNLQLTLVDYTKGRLEQAMYFSAVESSFPSSLSKHLTTVGDRRL